MEGITRFCFIASYSLALLMEVARLLWPRRGLRWGACVAGGAGLLAQSGYLLLHPPSPALPEGSLLLLTWVLAIFYLYGTLHYPRQAWGVFVLPVLLILLGLATLIRLQGDGPPLPSAVDWLSGTRVWGNLHGSLLLLAAVGLSVGFLASVMYLIQAYRLRSKLNPIGGLRLFSLERLERMNRRAINWAFPFLTAGLLLGIFLMTHNAVPVAQWASLKIAGTLGLWLVFLLLLYLRYGVHLPGRRLALWTIAAFGLMLITLASTHPVVQGGWR